MGHGRGECRMQALAHYTEHLVAEEDCPHHDHDVKDREGSGEVHLGQVPDTYELLVLDGLSLIMREGKRTPPP